MSTSDMCMCVGGLTPLFTMLDYTPIIVVSPFSYHGVSSVSIEEDILQRDGL